MSALAAEQDFSIESLNERASAFGCSVVREELVGHPFNMGQGAWCRVERDGGRVFKFSWRAEEVDSWLRLRERDAG